MLIKKITFIRRKALIAEPRALKFFYCQKSKNKHVFCNKRRTAMKRVRKETNWPRKILSTCAVKRNSFDNRPITFAKEQKFRYILFWTCGFRTSLAIKYKISQLDIFLLQIARVLKCKPLTTLFPHTLFLKDMQLIEVVYQMKSVTEVRSKNTIQ